MYDFHSLHLYPSIYDINPLNASNEALFNICRPSHVLYGINIATCNRFLMNWGWYVDNDTNFVKSWKNFKRNKQIPAANNNPYILNPLSKLTFMVALMQKNSYEKMWHMVSVIVAIFLIQRMMRVSDSFFCFHLPSQPPPWLDKFEKFFFFLISLPLTPLSDFHWLPVFYFPLTRRLRTIITEVIWWRKKQCEMRSNWWL